MKKTYRIVIEKRVSRKDLKAIPAKDRLRILQRVNKLAHEPYPAGHKKLENYQPSAYKIRQGNYRIIYRVENKILKILIIKVGHRREIYR